MLTRFHQIALLDPATGRVLVVPGEDRPRLPTYPGRWPDVRDLVAVVGDPGARLAGPPFREDDGTVTNVLIGARTTSVEGDWRALDDLSGVDVSAVAVEGVARLLREVREGVPDDGRAAWFVPGWREEVVTWVDDLAPRLGFERMGEPEEVKVWSLSAVLRFPVRRAELEEDLWFKATCEGFRGEPAFTRVIRELAPDVVPTVLAVDAERAWMLMESLPGADDGVPPECAPDAARRLARLQLETLAARADLEATGVPDRGLEATLAKLHLVTHESVERHLMTAEQVARARALEPWLVDRLRGFWSHGLPDALSHGDLHLGNAAWVGDRPVFFDWTDACFTHPFLDAWHLATSAAEECEDGSAARDAVRDAYLEAWRTAYPTVDVDAVWEGAELADAAFQAVTFEQIYRAQPEVSRWELATIVVEILDKLAEVRAASVP